MASYLDRAALARHESFRSRVQLAMLVTAVSIANEGPSGDDRKDALRSALATNILNDPDGYVARFTWAIVTNPTVAEAGLNAPDGDLEFLAITMFDAIAGV